MPVPRNYIKRLELEIQRATMEGGLRELLARLETPKFVGVDDDGDRKDWISTGELKAHLDAILFTS